MSGALVAAGLAALFASSLSYTSAAPASSEPYNLLVEGFRSGHLWLAKDAPPALVAAPNPNAYAAYRDYLGAPWNLVDLSYYRGHLYTYFGVTPALVLFWPWHGLTGAWIHGSAAALIFCLVGYALSLAVAGAALRRHYPGAGPAAAAAAALLLGSASTLPVFLARPGLFEVSIGCAYAFSMGSLACLWKVWHGSRGREGWLAAAALLFGLAVGARAAILLGGVILLFPAAGEFHSGGPGSRAGWRFLAAAAVPLLLVGAGLAAYNIGRFGDPLQFGDAYQISGNDVFGKRSFGLVFAADNLRLHFLLPPRWHAGFPFVWRPAIPPVAAGHLPVEFVFGVLPALPAVAAALAPLLIGRGAGSPGLPRALTLSLCVLFAAAAATICLYAGATSRYLLDFMPSLALLAVFGFLALEDAGPGAVPLLALLRSAVWAALVYTALVSWLLAVALVGFYENAERGLVHLGGGRFAEADAAFGKACQMNPDFRGQADLFLGASRVAAGRLPEGIAYLRSAVRESPELEAAHFNLGQALRQAGRPMEAAAELSRAAELDPKDGEADASLGAILFGFGRIREAIACEREALRVEPSLTSARRDLEAMEKAARAAPSR